MKYIYPEEKWVYVDNGIPVSNDPNRTCGYCNAPNRADGHDSCLGELPKVRNACCGHGIIEEAYVVLSDSKRYEGRDAIKIMQSIKDMRNVK